MSNQEFRRELRVGDKSFTYYSLPALEEKGVGPVSKLPYSIKVLLEAALRQVDGVGVTEEHVQNQANWPEQNDPNQEVPFKPARTVLQDFTGVPAVVDLAALRDSMAQLGQDPNKINPLVPADLVIDHSVMVDVFGSGEALDENMRIEFERNAE